MNAVLPTPTGSAAENEALRGQLHTAQLENEALRRQLLRSQTLCANQLYDLRMRNMVQSCFYALSRAQQKPAEALLLGAYPYSTPQQPPHALVTPAAGSRGAPSSRYPSGDAATPSCGPRAPASGEWWTATGEASDWWSAGAPDASSGVARGPAVPRHVVVSGSTATRGAPLSPTLDLVEAEERHDAQISSFMQALRASKSRMGKVLVRARQRHLLRHCLRALRAFAAEQLAWRGAKGGVLLAERVGGRLLLGATFVAWRLTASSAAEKREQTRAVVAVVSERLVEAEGHFDSLVAGQMRLRLQARDRLVGLLAGRHRERLLRSCWLALRLAATHHRLIGERQAWRAWPGVPSTAPRPLPAHTAYAHPLVRAGDLFHELQSEQNFRLSMTRAQGQAGSGSGGGKARGAELVVDEAFLPFVSPTGDIAAAAADGFGATFGTADAEMEFGDADFGTANGFGASDGDPDAPDADFGAGGCFGDTAEVGVAPAFVARLRVGADDEHAPTEQFSREREASPLPPRPMAPPPDRPVIIDVDTADIELAARLPHLQ